MPITHKYTIMCDEVRIENNGKLLLLGVYLDVILLPQIPATFAGLTFLMKLESDRPGVWTARLKLQHLDSGEKLMEAIGSINFQRPGPAVNPVRLPPFVIKAPGVYHFVVEIEGQSEPILYEFMVGIATGQAQVLGFQPKQ